MPPERNNTVRFSQLSALTQASLTDIIPIVDTSIPTLVNKKISINDLNKSLPVGTDVTALKSVSSNWDSVYSSFNANSAEYENTFSNIIANSANWDSTYTTVQNNSSAWTGVTTYSTVNSLSDTWNTAYALASSAYTSLSALSSGYWILKSGDQMTGALTTIKSLTTQFTNPEEFISKRYADGLALQAQVSGSFLPALYYTKTESDDRFFNQGETNLLVQNISSFTGNNINIHSNTLILSSQNNASSSPLFRMPRFNAGLYFDAERCIIRGDHWGDGDAGFIELRNSVTIGRSLTDAGLHVNVTNPKVFVLGNNTESGIGFSPTTNYVNSDTYLMREQPYHLAIRNGTIPQALRVYNSYVSSTNFERFGLSGSRLAYELSGSQRFYISSTATNGIIAWANNIGGFNTLDVYNGADWQFARNGSATHILRAGGSFETRAFGNGLTIDDGTGIRGGVLFEAADTVGIRNSTNSQNLRVYNTYTNATNYERLSLSATRIAYEAAGTGSVRDLTISTPGNLILSGASIQINSTLPFYYSSLSASKLTFDRAGSATSFSNPLISVPSNDGTYFLADGYSHIRNGSGPSIIFGSYGDQGGFATRINSIANSWNFWLTRDSSICWNSSNPNAGFTETGDLFLFRDAPYVLAIRDRAAQTGTNALRIYNNYTDANNYSRLSLSGSQIVFERAGTGPSANFNINNTAWNLSWASNGLIVERNGTQQINLAAISRIVIHRDMALAWSENPYTDQYSGDTFLRRDGSGILALNNSTSPGVYRIYNTYTDANNYERLSLSATRIAYEAAGTGVSRDLTIQSTGNLILSAGGIVNISSGLPTSFSSLTAGTIQVNVPQNTVQSSFAILSAGRTLFSVNSSETRRVNVLGNLQLDRETYAYPPRIRMQNDNNESYGELYMASGQLNVDGFNNGMLLPGYILIDPGAKGGNIGQTFVTIRNVSLNPQSFIKCLSSNGTTLFEVNSAGSFTASSFTFPAPTDFLGAIRMLNDASGNLRPGIYSTGNGVSLATYGNGGLSNVGSAFIQHILGRRAVFSGSSPAVGSGNFDETILNVAVKVGGLIGFTDVSLDGSNFVRPISATMGYDWSTNLIALSSRTNRVGIRFQPVDGVATAFNEIYNDGTLVITSNFGGGRPIYFRGINNQGWNPMTLNAYGAFVYGKMEITATQQGGTGYDYIGPYLNILQDNKQLSSYIRAVNSAGTTVFEVNSANNVFVRNLINFTNNFSTGPAIKGTSTTVQARTGDDSQYTYLQGKLQTDQAANAGTFTPDKYIILYDSTGTAYKVPVQAL
jgi:hypothetical protein